MTHFSFQVRNLKSLRLHGPWINQYPKIEDQIWICEMNHYSRNFTLSTKVGATQNLNVHLQNVTVKKCQFRRNFFACFFFKTFFALPLKICQIFCSFFTKLRLFTLPTSSFSISRLKSSYWPLAWYSEYRTQ